VGIHVARRACRRALAAVGVEDPAVVADARGDFALRVPDLKPIADAARTGARLVAEAIPLRRGVLRGIDGESATAEGDAQCRCGLGLATRYNFTLSRAGSSFGCSASRSIGLHDRKYPANESISLRVRTRLPC